MQRITKFFYQLVFNGFMFTAVSFLLSCFGGDGGFLKMWFGGLAIYGTIICVWIIIFHFIIFFLFQILKKFRNNKSEY
jgi:hypothetical protein